MRWEIKIPLRDPQQVALREQVRHVLPVEDLKVHAVRFSRVRLATGYLDALATAAATHALPLVRLELPASGAPYEGDLARSDHSLYWEKGLRGVVVTDTADFRLGHHYHEPADTMETLDFDFAEKVTATVADAVRSLAA